MELTYLDKHLKELSSTISNFTKNSELDSMNGSYTKK